MAHRALACALLLVLARAATAATGACQPLPAPTGQVVDVATVQQLVDALDNAAAGDVILVADGTYALNGAYLRIDTPNVTLRSASGNREAVVVDGNYETTEIVQIAASNVTVASLTLREAYNHAIHVVSEAADTLETLIYDVHLVDPAEQGIKINPAGSGVYTDYGTIACSHIELTAAGRPFVRNDCYTGGIDGHQSRGWVVRDNLIEGFWCASGLSEHAVHFWTGSRDTLVERNRLRDNARGVGLGLLSSGSGRTYPDNPCPTAVGYVDHYGGVVRNNFVSASDIGLFASEFGFDCGVCLWQACGATAAHNSVYSTQAAFSAVEWRFANTSAQIANNLVNSPLRERDGASATQVGNLTGAQAAWFARGATGDLHLQPGASAAIDQAAPWPAVTDDHDGAARPNGSVADVGADEYAAFRKGDLDHDGRADLLFRRTSTGRSDLWLMNGTTRYALVPLGQTPASLAWSIAGVDDFDRDLQNDVVLWNGATGQAEFWLLEGPTRIGAAVPLTPTLATSWRLAATGDFNQDQRPDVLWRNAATQKLLVWTMNGTAKLGELVPVPDQAVDANWEVVAALDYDGDGLRDLLWYNSTSGKLVQWLMNASVQRTAGRFTNPANAGNNNWKVLASSDYGAGPGGLAGTNDVVWRNATSGRVVVWHLDLAGNRTAGLFATPDAPSPNPTDWTIVGPR